MKSIFDPSFRYTPSVKTDLRKTFARIRRRQRELDEAQQAADAAQAEIPLNVQPINRARKR